MNTKAIIGGVVALVVVIGGFFAYKALSVGSAAAKWSGPFQEIAEEKVTHADNGVTHVRFVSVLEAPVAKVQEAIWNVENSQQMVENIKMSKLLESKGDTKLVEINLQPLNLPLLNYTMEWTLYPDQHRVTFKTVKSQAQDIQGEYQLEASPDGTRTRLTYTSDAKDKIALPIPQSVLDSTNRETYVNTIRGIKKFVAQG
jgi:hypothetical protein